MLASFKILPMEQRCSLSAETVPCSLLGVRVGKKDALRAGDLELESCFLVSSPP